MKILFLMIGCLTLACTVYPQKNNDIIQIEFTSLSRGGYSKEVKISRDSLITSFSEGRGADTESAKCKLNQKDWTSLMNSLEGVSITEIPDLPSPTMKRAYDGARHSSITITTTKDSSVVHSFDDENPHQKLQATLNTIQQLTEKYAGESKGK